MEIEQEEVIISGKKPIGYCIQRVREIRGMKQLELADFLGITQQALSKLENSATLKKSTVEKLAIGLGVTVEFLENFNDEAFNYSIINNFNSGGIVYGQLFHSRDSINNCPVEVFELMDKEIKFLREQNKQLLEQTNKMTKE